MSNRQRAGPVTSVPTFYLLSFLAKLQLVALTAFSSRVVSPLPTPNQVQLVAHLAH
jgi:hypothetical protein